MRQIANLVEEDGRTVGQLEAADLACERSGKRSLFAAEQLALDKGRRDGRTVDPDHRSGAARPELVDLSGKQLLAGPGFPQQQDGRISRRDLLNLFEHPPEGRTLSDDTGEPEALLRFAAQQHVLCLQLLLQALSFLHGPLQQVVAALPRQHLIEHGRDHLQPMQDLRRPRAGPADGIELHRASDASVDAQRHNDGRFDVGRPIPPAIDLVRYLDEVRKAHDLVCQDLPQGPRNKLHRRYRFTRGLHAGGCPTDAFHEDAVRPDLVKRAPIERKQVADSTQPFANRFLDLCGGDVDELPREFGDEPFELEPFFSRQPFGDFQSAALANVNDRGEDEAAIRGPDRSQPDLDREKGSVFAAAKELAALTHGPRDGLMHEVFTVCRMGGAEVLRYQQVDGSANELSAGVAELAFHLAVDADDRPAGVHHEHATRRGLDRQLERDLRVDAVTGHGGSLATSPA